MPTDSNTWKLWSQLSLSTSLDVWQNSADHFPDISIHLNYGVEHACPQAVQRGWTLDTLDFTPPDSVLRAQLERVQIQFIFSEIQKKQPVAKRIKSGHTLHDDQDVMLLDFSEHFDDGNVTEFAHAVEDMKGLSGLIKGCFESKPDVDEDPDLLLASSLPRLDHWREFSSHVQAQDSVDNESTNESSLERKRLPKAAVEIMERWLQLHACNPYPTRTEKLELKRMTGIQMCMIIGIEIIARVADIPGSSNFRLV